MTSKHIKEFAKSYGYDYVKKIRSKGGARIYLAGYADDEARYTGIPPYIIVEKETARFASYDETMLILDEIRKHSG